MKFKFCSDGDCPLWALAALHSLDSLPAALFRSLVQHALEEQQDDGLVEILRDTNLSTRDASARAAAAIRWVLQQTWSSGCSSTHLTRDLLVLGLPRTHASALAEAADAARHNHVIHAQTNGFMVNKVVDISLAPGPTDTADTLKLTLFTDDVFTGDHKRKELLIERSQAKTLLTELKKAYKKMEALGNE